jgi:hypothetical protein
MTTKKQNGHDSDHQPADEPDRIERSVTLPIGGSPQSDQCDGEKA